jgi:hypothetical protein
MLSTGQTLSLLRKRSPARVSQTSRPLEAYTVVNFKAHRISQGAHKLAQTPTLIKKYIYIKERTLRGVTQLVRP